MDAGAYDGVRLPRRLDHLGAIGASSDDGLDAAGLHRAVADVRPPPVTADGQTVGPGAAARAGDRAPGAGLRGLIGVGDWDPALGYFSCAPGLHGADRWPAPAHCPPPRAGAGLSRPPVGVVVPLS